MRHGRSLLPGVAVLLPLSFAAIPLCHGQDPAPPKRSSLTIQGSIRSRLEVWDWFDSNAGSNYAYLGSIARLSFGQQGTNLDWQLEFAAPILLGLPDNATAPGTQGQLGFGAAYYIANDRSRDAAMVFLKQGFLRFKNLFGGKAHSLRLGRFEFVDGGEVTPKNATLATIKRDRITQRLLGSFGWSHAGRSFDGFHYAWDRPSSNVTVIGAFPTRGVFQVDGWGELNVGFLYASMTKPFTAKKNTGELRVFGMYYQDWRQVLKTDNRPLALRRNDLSNIRIGTFGGHYLHAAETSAGVFDLLLWGSLQTGRWGRLDHRAGALAVEAGWQPAALPKLKPWLRGGFFHSTGDDNPLDSIHKTFFQLLPTPRPYARFPFFNLMNDEDFLGTLILRPHKAVTLASEVHALRLSSRQDFWYQGGGAFSPWVFGYAGRPSGGGRGLATLYDVSAEYRVSKAVTVTGYYGYTNGKSVMASVYPKGKNGSFGYVELLYRF